jgi:hypothetical protein
LTSGYGLWIFSAFFLCLVTEDGRQRDIDRDIIFRVKSHENDIVPLIKQSAAIFSVNALIVSVYQWYSHARNGVISFNLGRWNRIPSLNDWWLKSQDFWMTDTNRCQ